MKAAAPLGGSALPLIDVMRDKSMKAVMMMVDMLLESIEERIISYAILGVLPFALEWWSSLMGGSGKIEIGINIMLGGSRTNIFFQAASIHFLISPMTCSHVDIVKELF